MSCSRMKGLAVLAPLLFLTMAACEFVTDNQFATLTIQLTDAMDEQVSEAWVTITDVYLLPGADETDPPSDRVYVLEDGEETHELLSLSDDDVAFLAVGVEIPADTYEQLRLVMSDGCIIVEGGGETTVYSSSREYTMCGTRDGTLRMPSYGQSGLKIQLNGLELSGDQGILLDFDVSESYDQAGNSGMWVMHPVIHWSQADLTAGIDVSLSPGDGLLPLPGDFGLGDFSVAISPMSAAADTVDFEDADVDGTFEVSFRHLIPDNGPFELKLIAPPPLIPHLSTAFDDSPATVSPGGGQIALVEWVLESVDLGGGT